MAQRGMGILFMSTEIPEILGIADRILVMREGQITAEFSRAEATQERLRRGRGDHGSSRRSDAAGAGAERRRAA